MFFNATTFYGFWDYWELRHDVTFDGVNKLIYINPGVTALDIDSDIYSEWKEWSQTEDNMKYLNPWSVIGGEPTVEGQRLDVTFFLINGWKLKPYPGSYNLTLTGNIFDVDGGDIKVPADVLPFIPNNITINLNTSVIVRRVDSGGTDGIVTASLVTDQREALFNIDGNVVSILSLLQTQPITASLVDSQLATLNDIQSKLEEVWQLHGLDSGSNLFVSQTTRSFNDVVQSIVTTGSGSTQETTITRLP
tara:strand:- start:153 stop:899 length:747 start_codon:yes stop_codon:yes gene_type:complete